MVPVEIDKFDRTKGLKHLRHIIRSQRIRQAGNVESVVRDRSMFVGVDIETGRDGQTRAEGRKLGRVLPLRSLSLSLALLALPFTGFQSDCQRGAMMLQ